MKILIEFLDSIGTENNDIQASHNISKDYNTLAAVTKEVSSIDEKLT